jgi:predicted flap endonuclease-1-like 5' DNA nuclease
MTHYWIELAIWLLLAYFLGCLLGWFFRNLSGAPAPAATMATAAVAAAPKMMAATPAPAAPAAPAPVVAAAPGAMERPKGIAAARGGKADDLQRISGIGPKNEQILHELGFFHFDQIANWTASEQAWVDDHLKFHGRIIREEWVRQAGLLAAGKEAEFTREFGTGGLKGKDGKTQSGSHTRRS